MTGTHVTTLNMRCAEPVSRVLSGTNRFLTATYWTRLAVVVDGGRIAPERLGGVRSGVGTYRGQIPTSISQINRVERYTV